MVPWRPGSMPTIRTPLIQRLGSLTSSQQIVISRYASTTQRGRIVRTLFIGHQISGYYLSRSKAAYWDGKNELGERVASGVYVCELETPTVTQTRRLVIVK